MMTIAEMYKRSGGADRLHSCSQCQNFIQPDKKSRAMTCGIHPERPEVWKAEWMACRFFRETEDRQQTVPELKDLEWEQLSIFDMEGVTS